MSKSGCGVGFTMHRMCESFLEGIKIKFVTDGNFYMCQL